MDNEPADGNVLKMLLGAADPWFDDDPPSGPKTEAGTLHSKTRTRS